MVCPPIQGNDEDPEERKDFIVVFYLFPDYPHRLLSNLFVMWLFENVEGKN